MRYRDLREAAGPSGQIKDMVQMLLVTMTANGITEIQPEMLVADIKDKFNLDVSLSVLIDVVQELPTVQSADSQLIVMGNENEMPAEKGIEQSSKQKVADMAAKSPAKKPGIDSWT